MKKKKKKVLPKLSVTTEAQQCFSPLVCKKTVVKGQVVVMNADTVMSLLSGSDSAAVRGTIHVPPQKKTHTDIHMLTCSASQLAFLPVLG